MLGTRIQLKTGCNISFFLRSKIAVRTVSNFTTHKDRITASNVLCATNSILHQQKDLLETLSDDQYTFQSSIIHGSCGGHIRHALDHIVRPLKVAKEPMPNLKTLKKSEISEIDYDNRERNTDIEVNRAAAIAKVNELILDVREVSPLDLKRPVNALFMLSGNDGREYNLASTLVREIAFSVHHCIHHHAMIRCLVEHHFPQVNLDEDFGLAPSTIRHKHKVGGC